MFTTGKALAASAVLLSAAAVGWIAHGAVAGSAPLPPRITPSQVPAGEHGIVRGESRPFVWTPAAEVTSVAFLQSADAQSADSDQPGKPQLVIKYDDGKPDGKRSIAGTGEMIRFQLPDASQKLRSLRVHCARYGYPQPPDEDAEITITSEDGTDIVHTEFVPYATFQRGESRWTTIPFEEPVVVPETFWAILQFNAERTKGVYISFDTSTGGKHSRTGLPGGTSKDVNFGGDWMVQAILTKPE